MAPLICSSDYAEVSITSFTTIRTIKCIDSCEIRFKKLCYRRKMILKVILRIEMAML